MISSLSALVFDFALASVRGMHYQHVIDEGPCWAEMRNVILPDDVL